MLARNILRTRFQRPTAHFANHVRSKTSDSASSPDFKPGSNDGIIEMLKRSRQEEKDNAARNTYKLRAFSVAINTISDLKYTITSAEQACKITGVGPGIAGRIIAHLKGEEYDPTAAQYALRDLKRNVVALENSKRKADPKRVAVERLRAIPGIGIALATKLVDAGCLSLVDLRKPEFRSQLPSAVDASLDYIEHTTKQFTREEAEDVVKFIRENLSSRFEVILVGDFRRGAPTGSSIEILLLHTNYVHVLTPPPLNNKARYPKTPFHRSPNYAQSQVAFQATPFKQDAIETLNKSGLLASTTYLSEFLWKGIVRVPKRLEDGQWESRWQRLQHLKAKDGVYRRVEISLAPRKSRGAAMLALTGDSEFTRTLHTAAKKLGLLLDEYGLWRWHSLPPSKRTASGKEEKQVGAAPDAKSENEIGPGYWELIRADTEEDIMQELGMAYVEPEKRNFSFLLDKPRKSTKVAGTAVWEPEPEPQTTGTKRGRPRKSPVAPDIV